MQGDEEYARVLIEGILRPVAMMHVPVDDHDPLQSKYVAGVVGSDHGIVKYTEAHGLIPGGMMPGGSQQGIGVAHLTFHHRVNRVHRATCCIQGCFKRARAEHCLVIDPTPSSFSWSTCRASAYAGD